MKQNTADCVAKMKKERLDQEFTSNRKGLTNLFTVDEMASRQRPNDI
jgi:hypothetical protein